MTAPAPTPESAPAAAENPTPPAPEDKPLGPAGESALQAEREGRKAETAARKAAEKAAADLAARLKEYEDRDKTEAERQADRLANLEKSNRELALEKARYEAALTHGLSKDDLALLGPGDDIAERAALLAQRLAVAAPVPQNLPASPNAGRDAQMPDEDAEWEQFRGHVLKNVRTK